MKISYRNGNTTVFETQGLDGEISRTGDNRKFTYHFDNFGCPADVSDEDGAANSYQFLREGRKNNKLSKTRNAAEGCEELDGARTIFCTVG